MKHLLLTTIAAVLLVGCGGPPKDIREAARQGNIEAVKQYLAAGTDVNAKDDLRFTPLHVAAQQGHDRCKEIVELLIAAGADVNVKDGESGATPLHEAAEEGHKEVVELLIANGANVKAKTNNGTRVLDKANDREIAALLRKHGARY